MTIKNNQLVFQCLECKNNYKKDYKGLIKRFANKYEFCNGDNNKFILLLRIAVHSYECIDNWERFNGTSLTDKKAFCSEFNSENITDKDYAHAQKLFKELKLKNLRDYHDCMFKLIHYCLLMYLKTLGTSVLKYIKLTLLIFCLHRTQHGKLV